MNNKQNNKPLDQFALDKRALKAVALQFLINGMVISSIIPRLPEIRDALNVDLSSIGQVLTMATVGGIIGSLCSNWILRQTGTKNAMIFGTLLTLLILPLVAFTSSIWSLLLVLALLMFLDPIVDIAMNLQGSRISARRKTPVMSRLHGLWSIGSVLGGLLAATMAMLSVSLSWHLLLAASLMLIALVFIGGGLLTSDEAIEPTQKTPKNTNETSNKPTKLWIYALLGGTVFIPEMIGGDWSPFRAKDDLNASMGLAGMAYVSFTCGMVVGRLSGDYLAIKLGKIKQFQVAISLSIIGMTTVCLVNSLPLVFVGLFISGLGVSVLYPSLYDIAAQDPDRPSMALSIMIAGSRTIALIAPLTIGLLADTDMFNVGIAMALFALPCLFLTFFFMGHLIRKNHSVNIKKTENSL